MIPRFVPGLPLISFHILTPSPHLTPSFFIYIDFLISKFHIYKNKKGIYYHQYKEILNEIEKEKKIYKAKIQKEKRTKNRGKNWF